MSAFTREKTVFVLQSILTLVQFDSLCVFTFITYFNCAFAFQFVRFANIEEDTPSYHRRYDFFISKFSSMCHGNHENVELRDSIRVAGIRGLQGVIRKTVSDDLVENIWDKQHMEKIVPSLLFNMQNMVRGVKKFKTTTAKLQSPGHKINYSILFFNQIRFPNCSTVFNSDNINRRFFGSITTGFGGICTS